MGHIIIIQLICAWFFPASQYLFFLLSGSIKRGVQWSLRSNNHLDDFDLADAMT